MSDPRLNDISLILAKAKRAGFFEDVKPEEVDFLEKEAKSLFSNDSGFSSNFLGSLNKKELQRASTAVFPVKSMASPPVCTLSAPNAASTIVDATAVNAADLGTGTFLSKYYTVYGTIPTFANDGISSNDGAANIASNATASHPMTISFFTDAPKFELVMKGLGQAIRLLVDGEYAAGNDTSYAVRLPNDNNAYRYIVDFSGARKVRRIDLDMEGFGRFWTTNIGPYDSLFPTPTSDSTMVIMGDSFTEPYILDPAFPNIFQHLGYGTKLGKLLGIPNTIVSGIGGTGYITVGSGATFPNRAQNDIGKFKPKFCLIFGGINDNPINLATYQQAVDATVKNVWRVSPDTIIFLAMNGNYNTGANSIQEQAYAAIEAKYRNSVFFLSEVTPSKIYTFNNGHVGSRVVTDGATTASSTTVTSATAAFTSADVGHIITGGTIPARTVINSVTNGTTVILSAAPTATATGLSLTITNQTLTGNGNIMAGTDGTHPTLAGCDYLAFLLFQAISSRLPN